MADSTLQVQVVTIIALILFSLAMVYLGISASKKTKTMDSFLLGNRNIGAWMSAFAYGTTYFSAVIFIGYAGKQGWDIGLGGIWIGIGNAVLGCFLAWKVLARRSRSMTRAMNTKTMPEFFEARYNDKPMKFFSAVVIFVFLVPYSSAVYKGLGSLFNTIFPNVSVNVCMLIVACLTAFFLVLGGYLASVYTDFVQGLIMIFGVVSMVLIVVLQPQVGGLGGAISKLRAIDPSLISPYGGKYLTFLCTNILLTSFGTWGLPQMVSKFYAVKDEGSIKRATVISTVFAAFIGVGAYFVGSLSRLYLSELPQGGYDAVIPQVLLAALGDANLFSTIVLALILILLLSASMSTLSAIVLTSSSAISVDLMPHIVKSWQGKKQMAGMRILCLLFVALSFVFATMQIAIIVSIMSFSWGIVSGSFIGPYLWGLYWKKTTKLGARAGMLGGFFTVIVCTIVGTATSSFAAASANAPIFGVSAMAVSLVIVPIASLITPKLPEKTIAAAWKELN
ncbi:MAG: sodium:solute symporter [Clostridiales bacterium]|jgi:SSS family solute:Na+ symporter/sodium/proline symporter|nr:sodium:solute symporter [Clostridiales bacterium]